jgi:hypothetical protein
MYDPHDLLKTLKMCHPEIDRLFLLAAYWRIDGLIPQYPVLNYHIDFAIPGKMIAIELDGHENHKSRA